MKTLCHGGQTDIAKQYVERVLRSAEDHDARGSANPSRMGSETESFAIRSWSSSTLPKAVLR